MLKYFTPPENSGDTENSTESSGPHAKNFFCSLYEMSQRHPVWVAENRVKPCNSVPWIPGLSGRSAASSFPRGGHPGFSLPLHGQGAPVLSGNGELLQEVSPRSGTHPPTPDGQVKWQQEGVGAKSTNNCYFLQISFILEYTVKTTKQSFHDWSKNECLQQT